MRRPDPAATRSLLSRLLSSPTPLPFSTWLERHSRASLALVIWITVVVGWSAASGHSGAELLAFVAPLLLAALIATRISLPLFARELGLVVGLFTGAAMVAGLAEGSVIAPVSYYLALVIVALYERRQDLYVGLALTFCHQAVAGVVIPDGARISGLPDGAATALFALSFVLLSVLLAQPWAANRLERQGRAREAARTADYLTVSDIVVELTLDGRVARISDQGLGVLGRSREEVVGHDWVDLVVEERLRPMARAGTRRFVDPTAGPVAASPQFFQFEHAILNSAGERRIFRWRTTVATEFGQIVGTVTSGVDITETRQAQRQLLREQRDLARLALLAQAVAREPDARASVVEGIIDLADATFAALCEPNEAGDAVVATRCTKASLIGAAIPLNGASSGTALAFTSGEPVFVADAADSPLLNQLLREAAGACSFQFQPVFVDDEVAAVLVVGWPERIAQLGTRQTNLVALAAEEAASALHRVRAMQRWEEAALTDVLTGAPNRRAFERMFDEALRHAADDGHPLTVALMDLNGFKALNDSEGHAAGDRVLKECAALWAAELRPTDVLARLGGDEFAVLLPSCGSGHAEAVASRLRGALRHPAGCGVGFAVWNGEEAAGDLLHRADEALYADKAAGARRRLTEAARLSAMEATGLLDAPADPELDEITRLATELVHLPIAAVTMVTPDRQFFASQCGLSSPLAEAREFGLEYSNCQHPATTGRELIVSDTREHELLKTSLSTTEGGLHAYAGIPLRSGGQVVGVLCAADITTRQWTPDELAILRNLAARAADHIAERMDARPVRRG